MNILFFLFLFIEIPHYTDFLNLYSGNSVSRGGFISNFLNETDFIKKNPAFFKGDTLGINFFMNPCPEKEKIKDIPYFLSLSLVFPLKNVITGIDFDLFSNERFTVYSGSGDILKNYVPKSFYIGTFFLKKFRNFITGCGIGISRIEEPSYIWPYEPEVFYLPALNFGFSLVFKNLDLSFSILNIANSLKRNNQDKIYPPLGLNFNSSFNFILNNIKIVPGINFEIVRDHKGKFKNYSGTGFEFIKKGNPEVFFDLGYISREGKGVVYGFKIRFENFKFILSETGLLTNYKKLDLHFGIETFFELIEI